MIDCGVCDFNEDLDIIENKFMKILLNIKYVCFYIEFWFVIEMWKNLGKIRIKMKFFKEIFWKKKYLCFLDE